MLGSMDETTAILANSPTRMISRDNRSKTQAPSALFSEFFCAEYPKLLRCVKAVGGSSNSEDVCQEAFAVVLTHWKSAMSSGNPSGYLYRCAFRQLSKEFRRNKRDHIDTSPGADLQPTPLEDFAETLCTIDELEKAISNLTPRARACTIAYFYLGLNSAEIARALRITPGTVRKHLSDAREVLRNDPTFNKD